MWQCDPMWAAVEICALRYVAVWFAVGLLKTYVHYTMWQCDSLLDRCRHVCALHYETVRFAVDCCRHVYIALYGSLIRCSIAVDMCALHYVTVWFAVDYCRDVCITPCDSATCCWIAVDMYVCYSMWQCDSLLDCCRDVCIALCDSVIRCWLL